MILTQQSNYPSTQFRGRITMRAFRKIRGRGVGSGIWSSLTSPECRIRFQSFRREHAPSTMLLSIFLLMAGFTSSTLESSRNWSVLACVHVCWEMEPNQEAGMAGKPIRNELVCPLVKAWVEAG